MMNYFKMHYNSKLNKKTNRIKNNKFKIIHKKLLIKAKNNNNLLIKFDF